MSDGAPSRPSSTVRLAKPPLRPLQPLPNLLLASRLTTTSSLVYPGEGDGALFVVSAVSPPAGTVLRRRVLRVYNRDGALQATAEAVPGLEHSLSWRPSGNLIVSTQRFGTFPGGGKGREGRHDVVFFEKNGLRHGEFGLRHETSVLCTLNAH
jgi:hypothetical protein